MRSTFAFLLLVLSVAHGSVLDWTVTDVLDAFQSGEISVHSYVTLLIRQIQANSDLNAFITFNETLVLAHATEADERYVTLENPGKLNGLPILVKDNYDTVEYQTTAGTPGLVGNFPTANALIIQTLLNEGAIVLGKTNMHELAFGITSNNAYFGPVRNPYDKNLIPGGSSGGSAAGLAARFAPLALGTDTGGSNRIPPALCGVFGFRPTVGRYSQQGIVPISHTRDTGGPMARSVRDLAIVDAILTQTHPPNVTPFNLKRLRLGVDYASYLSDNDAQLQAVVDSAVGKLKKAGVTIVNVSLASAFPLNDLVSFPVALYEVLVDLAAYLATTPLNRSLEYVANNTASPDVHGLFEFLLFGGGAIPQAVYDDAIQVYRPLLKQTFFAVFSNHSLHGILFPTTPLPARPIGQDVTVELNGQQVPTFTTYIRYTDPGSNAGIPGLSFPVGLTESGLPVGMEIDGPEGSDRTLLSIGLSVDRLFKFKERPSDIVYINA